MCGQRLDPGPAGNWISDEEALIVHGACWCVDEEAVWSWSDQSRDLPGPAQQHTEQQEPKVTKGVVTEHEHRNTISVNSVERARQHVWAWQEGMRLEYTTTPTGGCKSGLLWTMWSMLLLCGLGVEMHMCECKYKPVANLPIPKNTYMHRKEDKNPLRQHVHLFWLRPLCQVWLTRLKKCKPSSQIYDIWSAGKRKNLHWLLLVLHKYCLNYELMRPFVSLPVSPKM